MITRTPVYKLMLAAGAVSILGLVCFVKLFGTTGGYYEPGTTREYHPPATSDIAAAEQALNQLEASTADGDPQHLFIPQFTDGSPLAVETRLSHQIVPTGETTSMHAAVAVRSRELSELIGSTESAESERAGLNIALVIDRSGSMTGMKLHNAKAASRALIDYLGPRDRLAIVSYGTDVTTLSESLAVTDQNRDVLHGAVASIRCHGGTNLSGGFARGRELVEGASGGDRINRILLLSDGQANEGITSTAELGAIASNTLEGGTSVTTMGVGLDYNENLLQKMATSGAGNYYFIEDESTTEEVFAAELRGLKSIVARDTELRLSLPPGATFVGVSGVDHRLRGRDVVIDLDTFGGGEQKDLLVELKFKPQHRGQQVALQTRLVYTDVTSDRGVVDRKDVTVDAGDDRIEADELVLRRVLQIRTAKAFSDAMVLYDRGDRFAAADLIEQRKRETSEFVETNRIDDPMFDRIDARLGELAEALRETRRHSTKGKWIAKSTKYQSANAEVSSAVTF